MEPVQLVKWSVLDSIGILTISNKPENYLESPEFINPELLKEITKTNSLKGLVICGEGRHFSAGANITKIYELANNEMNLGEKLNKGKEILSYIENLPIPTIAAIKGSCFGGGLEIALACHIRVCSKNALFAFPEANLNLMPGLGGTIRLPKLIGSKESIEMILPGDLIDAEKAFEIKLVDYIIHEKDVVGYSTDLLKKITKDRPVRVIHSIIKSINNAKLLSFDKAMQEETKMFCKLALDEVLNKKSNCSNT